ncbi:MAG TPA: hypothetical protein VGB16_05170 [candidate division Zixibacteria bacterium]
MIGNHINKPLLLSIGITLVLFSFLSSRADELKVQDQGQLKSSEEAKLPDTSSVPPDTIQEPSPEPILADTTIIVPLLDFKDVEIRDILNSLAKAYKLNLWLDPSIAGKTTVYFEKVPLNDILRFIIRQNNLEYERTGDIIKIRAKQVIVPAYAQRIEYKDNLLSVDLKGMELEEAVREVSVMTPLQKTIQNMSDSFRWFSAIRPGFDSP